MPRPRRTHKQQTKAEKMNVGVWLQSMEDHGKAGVTGQGLISHQFGGKTPKEKSREI